MKKTTQDPADRLWRLLDSFFVGFSAGMDKLRASQEKLEAAQEASFAKSQAEWKEIRASQEKLRVAQEASFAKSQAEWREMKAFQKETDRKMRETDKQMKETDRKIKKIQDIFVGQWGKLMESLVEGGLIQAFNTRNIEVHYNMMNVKKEHGKHRFEFDIISVNHSEVVVTESKTALKIKDVDLFLIKLDRFTDYIPEYKEKKIYGAVAFLQAHQSSDRYAEKKGLFVIKAAGGNIPNIINKKNFKPKCFS